MDAHMKSLGFETINIMFEHAYKKWAWVVENWKDEGHYIIDHGFRGYDYNLLLLAIPELLKYEAYGDCSLCYYYKYNCDYCPLATKMYNCHDAKSLFYKAYFNLDKKAAIKLRDKIKRLWDKAIDKNSPEYFLMTHKV